MEFLNRNSGAIQALGAILTVILALGALVGVKMQIDSADAIQKSQSARDIYREFLSLSVNKPEFSQPDYCAISKSPQSSAYEAYVEYLLYTADQLTGVEKGWQSTFAPYLETHANYICSITEVDEYSDSVADLITEFKAESCKSVRKCP